MKKLILIIGISCVLGILVYIIPRVQGARDARPLSGIFDIQMKCMGGHEVFLELEGDSALGNCPGHREREFRAKVIRDDNSATVIDPRDEQPWFRIEWDGSKHSLTLLKPPDSQSEFGMIRVRGEIHQVNDPWRLWLPRLLPGD
jgi:hypothetical protein